MITKSSSTKTQSTITSYFDKRKSTSPASIHASTFATTSTSIESITTSPASTHASTSATTSFSDESNNNNNTRRLSNDNDKLASLLGECLSIVEKSEKAVEAVTTSNDLDKLVPLLRECVSIIEMSEKDESNKFSDGSNTTLQASTHSSTSAMSSVSDESDTISSATTPSPIDSATSKKRKIGESNTISSATKPSPIDGAKSTYASGYWTHDEHKAFLECLKKYNRNFKKFVDLIPTRTYKQILNHAHSYSSNFTPKLGRPKNPVDFVNDLLCNRCEETPDDLGLFTCLVPKGKGIITHHKGYKTTSTCFDGVKKKKQRIHRLVYKTVNNDESIDTLEVSHLCGNAECSEPKHLIAETSKLNQQRKNCIGYTLFKNELVCACRHNPKCKIATADVLQVVSQPSSDIDVESFLRQLQKNKVKTE